MVAVILARHDSRAAIGLAVDDRQVFQRVIQQEKTGEADTDGAEEFEARLHSKVPKSVIGDGQECRNAPNAYSFLNQFLIFRDRLALFACGKGLLGTSWPRNAQSLSQPASAGMSMTNKSSGRSLKYSSTSRLWRS